METWVIVLILFGGFHETSPAITTIPLGITTKAECEKIVQSWQDLALEHPHMAACIKIGDFKT